jgi:uncharacterized cupredoxin-like copper-binding protein
MTQFPSLLVGCAVVVAALVMPAAAEAASSVNVALTDMSANSSGPGGKSIGMMGSGMMSRGMMGADGAGMLAIRVDETSVMAGKVTFAVTNESRAMVHEILVVAVDNPDVSLPYDSGKGIIIENKIKVLGETSELQPRASKSITLTMSPGNYLLICNVPGHYAAGMVLPFSVTP